MYDILSNMNVEYLLSRCSLAKNKLKPFSETGSSGSRVNQMKYIVFVYIIYIYMYVYIYIYMYTSVYIYMYVYVYVYIYI